MARGFWIAGALIVALLSGACERKTDSPAPAPAAQGIKPASAPAERGNGVVRGRVTFTGTPPEMTTIANVPCHDGAKPMKEETVVVNANGTLRNVLVYLKDAPETSDGAAVAPVVLDQVDCRYVPHVIGVQTGQTLVLKSSDPTLHNVHYNPDRNPPANFGFTSAGSTHDVSFAAAGDFIRVKCDVHPWMTGYVGVFDNPWFAVTGDTGAFELKGVPPGQYKLAAWHELYGTKEVDVTVSNDKPVEATIAFASP